MRTGSAVLRAKRGGEHGEDAIVVAALLGPVAPVLAQDLPPCTVGQHLDVIGGNGSGTIIDADAQQGSYRVQYDNTTMTSWVTSVMLRNVCTGAPAGPTSADFYVGAWDEVHQRGDTDLIVHPDGTYEWLVQISPESILRGTWSPTDEVGSLAVGPGIVLHDGLYGHDWFVESRGEVDDDDRESILASDNDRNDYYFFRTSRR